MTSQEVHPSQPRRNMVVQRKKPTTKKTLSRPRRQSASRRRSKTTSLKMKHLRQRRRVPRSNLPSRMRMIPKLKRLHRRSALRKRLLPPRTSPMLRPNQPSPRAGCPRRLRLRSSPNRMQMKWTRSLSHQRPNVVARRRLILKRRPPVSAVGFQSACVSSLTAQHPSPLLRM